ncbi:hypothetical protein [Niabella hirudinis]|uniref:hypothetical protein n=1 Tax=Niabella hirudinis TaxID=1285929 RepID=UPI003EBF9D37
MKKVLLNRLNKRTGQYPFPAPLQQFYKIRLHPLQHFPRQSQKLNRLSKDKRFLQTAQKNPEASLINLQILLKFFYKQKKRGTMSRAFVMYN